MKITTGSAATMFVARLQPLPQIVPDGRHRFYCRVLREDRFKNTYTLDVDGAEVTVSKSQVTLGLVGGQCACDLVSSVALKQGLA